MVFLGDYNGKKIEEVVEDFLFRRGYELVDLKLDAHTSRTILEIYADKLGGITIRDLSEINERLKLHLETSELLPREFSLVVSSPGLDRVIKKEADFIRFVGRRIRMELLNSGGKNNKIREVLLVGFEAGDIIIESESDTIEKIPFAELKRVRLVPDFDLEFQKGGVDK